MKKSSEFYREALILSAPFMIWGLFSLAETSLLLARGQAADGIFMVRELTTVTPSKRRMRNPPPIITVTYPREVYFTTKDKHEFRVEPFFGPFPCLLNQDDRVGVIYFEDDPSKARALIFSDLWGKSLLSLAFGSLPFGFGVVRLRRKILAKRRRERRKLYVAEREREREQL